jgi:hypothetical protein
LTSIAIVPSFELPASAAGVESLHQRVLLHVGGDHAQRQVVALGQHRDHRAGARVEAVQAAVDGEIPHHRVELGLRPSLGPEDALKRRLRAARDGVADIDREDRDAARLERLERAPRVTFDVELRHVRSGARSLPRETRL